MKKPKPVLLSINICDTIIRDEITKKVSLIGLFNVIKANTFPAKHPMLQVYVALTNGHGSYKADLRIQNVDENKIIMNLEAELTFANPLYVVEINFGLQGLKFDKPGKYSFQVLCDGEPIGSRDFTVMGPQTLIPPTEGTARK
jgi:hypothetical protein